MKQNKNFALKNSVISSFLLFIALPSINEISKFSIIDGLCFSGSLFFALLAIIHAMPDSPKEWYNFSL